VVYLLDSQWDFPLVNAVFGEQYYDGFVPELVTVGVAWSGRNLNYDTLRVRDFTPTALPQVPSSGKGPKFLEFLKNELIPYIDATFRTVKGDRTLMGSSLGGLFTLYVLFHETGLFGRYILTSPALEWDNGVVFAYEKDFAAKNSRLPARVYMAIGGLEGGEARLLSFADQLRARKHEGLEVQTRVLEGTGHSGSKAEGYARGLQAVFARTTVDVNPVLLDSYAGRYQLNRDVTIGVVKEDGRLFLIAPDSTRIPLLAETEREFYVKGSYLFLRFDKDESGKTTGLHVEQFAGEVYLRRIE
jgi:predicted alpha/beta superfamily hydrolase